MNRSKLKAYAPKARRDFIRAVTDRAARFGITASQVEPAHEQGDAVVILGTPYPRSAGEQRRKLLRRIEINAFEQVMEEAAYTWFNRFAAILFMEVNGYLDHGLRVLSHPAGKAIPEILEKAELAELPGLPKDKVLEMKLDGRSDAELYRLLLVAQCNALHKAMPFLFERIDDETELLLPDNLLHSDSVIRQMVEATDEADWRQIEIIGWLYQFYIAEKKEQVIGKVVRSEDIPAATQLFTPNWIVKYMVQNSLGAKWLATYPDSPLKAKMEYYIEPAEQTAEVQAQLAEITPKSLDPEAITLMDPASGSGHILIEAYNLFREIYLERGYQTRDIPRLILEKNVYGLEICDRAAQLAGFAVLMRAQRDDARILESPPKLNILAIQSSKGLNAKAIARQLLREEWAELIPTGDLLPATLPQPTLSAMTTSGLTERDIRDLLALFEDAKTFGSLIQMPEMPKAKLAALRQVLAEEMTGDLLETSARIHAVTTLMPLALQAEMLAREYDVVATNPPYMGGRGIYKPVKSFLDRNYPNAKTDIYAAFLLRSGKFSKFNGYASLITMETWMFLSSYSNFRKDLVELFTFRNLYHCPYEGRSPTVMGLNFGVSITSLSNATIPHFMSRFFCVRNRELSANGIPFTFPTMNERTSIRNPRQFLAIPGAPFAYWLSERILEVFSNSNTLGDLAPARQGLATADNDVFVRRWFEVNINHVGFHKPDRLSAQRSKKKWFPYNKGGNWRKWYGNQEFIVDWEMDGERIRKNLDSVGNVRSRPQNVDYYFKCSISWSDITSANTSFRKYPEGFIYDITGMSAFAKSDRISNVVLGFCNTKIVGWLTKALNPTLHFQIGNYQALPLLRGMEKQSSFYGVEEAVTIAKCDWDAFETSWDFQKLPMLSADMRENRENSVATSYEAWKSYCTGNIARMKAVEEENNRFFIEAYGLKDELTSDVPENQITLARADREVDIKRLISYALGCMMGRYSLDEPGLIYAHAGNEGFDPGRYQTFPADADGIVPVTDLDWFADDAANRFIEFIKVAWPMETLAENLAFVAESLGTKSGETAADTIRRYLSQSFFKDHLQTYKRRPIYWLFSSGKQKAFEALVYLHRYNEGTLARLRMAYVTPLMAMLRGRIEQLDHQAKAASSTAAARKLEKSRSRLLAKQCELVEFDEKLRHYADLRITLDLDDGVKVNYAKFGDLLAETKAVTGQKEE